MSFGLINKQLALTRNREGALKTFEPGERVHISKFQHKAML